MVSRLPVLLALPVVAALAACSPQPAGTDAADMPDFAPTRDNAVLRFGDTARVATEDPATGTQVQWEVTVERPRRITGTQAANNLRSPDPQRFAAFTCFPVTLTPVAIGSNPTGPTVPVPLPGRDGTELAVRVVEGAGVASISESSGTGLGDGSGAGSRAGSGSRAGAGAVPGAASPSAAEAYCDMGSGAPSGYTADLEEGRAYTTALASWERRVDPGVPATGVRLDATGVRWAE
ncbi:hypothetical protein ACUY2P_10380 [Corynebacterium hadale]